MDRRAQFFFGVAVLCVAMVWPTPPDFRWVPWALTATYVALGIGAWLDGRSGNKLHPPP